MELGTSDKEVLQQERSGEDESSDLLGRKDFKKITGKFKVREDKCLADKLQKAEFDLHFGKNKDERQRGKINTKAAKSIYLREVEESGLLSKQLLKDLSKDGTLLAAELDQQLAEKKQLDARRKVLSEMQDAVVARSVQVKETETQIALKLERQESEHYRNEKQENGVMPHERAEDQIRLEEEQDRQIAIKLQKQESEHYRNEKQEKEIMLRERAEEQKRLEERDRLAKFSRTGVTLREVPSYAQAEDQIALELLHQEEEHYRKVKQEIWPRERDEDQERPDEERDRQIALKLQKQEAEQYRIAKMEQKRMNEERDRQFAMMVQSQETQQYRI